MQTYNDGTMDNKDPALARLMSLPVHNPERNRLRDVIRYSGKQLETRAFKYLTMAGEYRERKTARNKMLEPEPDYRTRLNRLTAHLVTQRRCAPLLVPSYTDNVQSYIRTFDTLNGLKSCS